MTADRPAPLIAAEVVLRDLDYMPFDGRRAFGSDTWVECSADEKVAALRLWWSSWHQEPAGSLPDNDRVLADLAGYGVAVEAWQQVRPKAMRGWVLCSDGRLYHPVVCEFAEAAWKPYRRSSEKRANDRRRLQLKREGTGRQTGAVAATNPDNRSDTLPLSHGQTPEVAATVAATKGKSRRDFRLNVSKGKIRELETSRTIKQRLTAARASGAADEVEEAKPADPAEPKPTDAADALISAFDDALEAVTGHARPFPAPADYTAATRLVAAGVTPDVVRRVAEARLRQQQAQGKRLAGTLAYLEGAISDALVAPPQRNGAHPTGLRPLTAAQRRAKLEAAGLDGAPRSEVEAWVRAEGLTAVWRFD